MNFVKYFFEIYMNFSVFFLQNAEFSLFIAKFAVLLSKKAPFSAKKQDHPRGRSCFVWESDQRLRISAAENVSG